jgi:hypothetical protein
MSIGLTSVNAGPTAEPHPAVQQRAWPGRVLALRIQAAEAWYHRRSLRSSRRSPRSGQRRGPCSAKPQPPGQRCADRCGPKHDQGPNVTHSQNGLTVGGQFRSWPLLWCEVAVTAGRPPVAYFFRKNTRNHCRQEDAHSTATKKVQVAQIARPLLGSRIVTTCSVPDYVVRRSKSHVPRTRPRG